MTLLIFINYCKLHIKFCISGRRKSATPNLGTSAYSLYSEDGKNLENKCAKLDPQDSKPKKPFLRRLMSCLVMRSTLTTRGSELKLPVGPPRKLPSLNSSIDSYHISTSLGVSISLLRCIPSRLTTFVCL